MLSIRRALNASCAAAAAAAPTAAAGAPQACVMHTLSSRQHSSGLNTDTQKVRHVLIFERCLLSLSFSPSL